MANSEEIKKLKQSGWDDMEALLDQHMPTKKRKFFPWFIAASLILLVGAGYYFLQPSPPSTIANTHIETSPTSSNNNEISIQENSNNLDIKNADPSSINSHIDSENTINTNHKTQPLAVNKNRNTIESATTRIVPITQENDVNTVAGNTEKTKEAEVFGQTVINNRDDYNFNNQIIRQDRTEKSIVLLSNANKPLQDIAYTKEVNLDNHYIDPVNYRLVKTNYFILAGDQLSSANDIHYLQLSPGISWTKSKWTAYIAAGLQFTAPSTKTINKENSPLFDQLDIQNSKQEDFASSGGQVPSSIISNTTYYQKLNFNPGLNTMVGLAYSLTPKWDIDWSIGHYWLTYNHELKYIGNNAERLQIDQKNIKTNLSYSSLKLSYHLNSHFKIQIGTAFANIFKPKAGEWQLASALAYTF